MTKATVPDQLYILTSTAPAAPTDGYDDLEPRRGPRASRLPQLTEVSITHLQQQVNVFLTQLDTVMQDTPEQVGGFRVNEFEVSVGIVVEAKGKLTLALVADAEAGGGINAGIKFVFKRP
jgi:hypothetical protein